MSPPVGIAVACHGADRAFQRRSPKAAGPAGRRYPNELAQSPATLPAARQGIAVGKERSELRRAISRALVEMIDDGTYHAILVEHLGSDERARAGSIVEAEQPPVYER